MSNLEERIRALSSKKLLDITINLRDDYQEEALVIADQELKNRNLSESELELIKSELNEEIIEKNRPSIFTKGLNNAADLFNPLDKNPTFKKWIKAICFYLTISYLFNLDSYISIIYNILVPSDSFYSFQLFYGIPIIYVPVCIYFLWNFKPIGWKLTTVYFSLSFWSYLLIFSYKLYDFILYHTSEKEASSMVSFEGFELFHYQRYFPMIELITLFIIGFIFKFMNKIEILELFQISSKRLKKQLLIYPLVLILLFNLLVIFL